MDNKNESLVGGFLGGMGLKPAHQSYFINVYRNELGNIAHSESGLMDKLGDALTEAYEYTTEHRWEYISTLSNTGKRIDLTEELALCAEQDAEEEADIARHGTMEQQAISDYYASR